MIDPDKEREIWLNYIGRLHERVVNQRKVSGFTMWALIGVLILLSSKVLDKPLLLLTNSYALFSHLLATIILVNLCFFGVMFYAACNMLFFNTKPDESRFPPKWSDDPDRISFLSWPLYVILACLNIVSAQYARIHELYSWPFWALGIFFSLQCFVIFRNAVAKYYNKLTHKVSPLIFIPSSEDAPIVANFLRILSIIFFIPGLIISIISVVQAMQRINSQAHVDILIWALSATGILCVTILLCSTFDEQIARIHLQELEQRIVMERLTPDEIRVAFIKEFLGETIKDWITQEEKRMQQFYNEFMFSASNAEEILKTRSKVTCNGDNKIKIHLQEVFDETSRKLDDYADYAGKLIKQTKHLSLQVTKGRNANQIYPFVLSWENQLQDCKTRFQLISDQYKTADQKI